MAKSSIVANDLVIKKGKKTILGALNFAIEPGVLYGLIGPSGAGKTTLMRSIVGIQRVTDGSLEVLNLPAGSRHLRSKINYVTQSPSVYGDLTVEQNLKYFARIMNAPKSDVQGAINAVHLDSHEKQIIATLSGGELARVSLAAALLGNPEVIILDEPTVGLDPLLREDLWSLFSEVASTGRTLLISSHVMDEAERCEKILLLRGGKLLWQEGRGELLKSSGTSSVEQAFLKLARQEEKS